MTGLIYKAGIHKDAEKYTGLKYSVSVGVVFLVISLFYFITRDERSRIQDGEFFCEV